MGFTGDGHKFGSSRSTPKRITSLTITPDSPTQMVDSEKDITTTTTTTTVLPSPPTSESPRPITPPSKSLSILNFGRLMASPASSAASSFKETSTIASYASSITTLTISEAPTPRPASLLSSASSFVDESSRPTTPQKNAKSSISFSSMVKVSQTPSQTLLKVEEPPHPALVNEFQGLDFDRIINSFIEPATSANPDAPVPRKVAQDLAETCSDLLDRIYSAYLSRTTAVKDVLDEKSVLAEELAQSRANAQHLQSKLNTEREDTRRVMEDLMQKIATQQMGFADSQAEWEERKDEWERKEREKIRVEVLKEVLAEAEKKVAEEAMKEGEMTPRKLNRTSSATGSSDSGFDESDEEVFSEVALDNSSTTEKKQVENSVPATPIRARSVSSASVAAKRAAALRALQPPAPIATKCESCNKSLVGTSPISFLSPTSPRSSLALARGPVKTPSTPAQSSRWSFGVLRGGGGGNANNSSNDGKTQAELDRLRTENRQLRESVAEFEKAAEDAVGMISGYVRF